MDVSSPCDIASGYVYSASDSINALVNHKQHMYSNKISTEVKVAPDVKNTSSEVPYVQEIEELMSSCTLAIDEESSHCREKEDLSDKPKLNKVCSTTEKVLGKYATFPSSRKLAEPVFAGGNDDVLDISCDDGQCSMTSDNPMCTRSISLPTSLKLVSAMKGNRERQCPHEKFLAVRWAPDVYDPPVTSLSHTVKGYSQQRSRTNKKNSKNKHKGKSSRGSTDKKHYRRHNSNSEPRSMTPATANLGYSMNLVLISWTSLLQGGTRIVGVASSGHHLISVQVYLGACCSVSWFCCFNNMGWPGDLSHFHCMQPHKGLPISRRNNTWPLQWRVLGHVCKPSGRDYERHNLVICGVPREHDSWYDTDVLLK